LAVLPLGFDLDRMATVFQVIGCAVGRVSSQGVIRSLKE
jgi:hypothetical protein